MNCQAPSANFAMTTSRNCTRCKKPYPLAEFKVFRLGNVGIYCSRCRAYERDRYIRKGKAVKRAYYARQKAELSPVEWRAQRLRYKYRIAVTPEWLEKQWKEQSGRCAITGRPLDWATVELDHIVPRSRGGANELSNLRLACREGNTLKRNMFDDELVALCREVLATVAR